MNYKPFAIFLGICFSIFSAQAQEDDPIGTQTVNVVKAYSPTVGDAVKIKSTPQVGDSVTLQKKPVQYSIFSVPVASTFTPAKGKASGVKKRRPEKQYDSYASVGLGNYNNALVDFYTSAAIDRDSRLDVGLNHHSSRGAVDGVVLDNDFYNTSLNAAYARQDRYMGWGIEGGFTHKIYHWYGVLDDTFPEGTLDGVSGKQSYYNAQLGGNLKWDDAVIKEGKVLLRRFWDGSESGENRAMIAPVFELPIADELFTIEVKADYVGGQMGANSLNASENLGTVDYHAMQFGVSPGITILRDELTLNLGAKLLYGDDSFGESGGFYIYPDITASFRISGDNVIAYGGLQGDLEQNSYFDYVNENPYVSPTLTMSPTDRQYLGYAGLKGQLLPNLSYDVRGSYSAENRKPLFLLNPTNAFRQPAEEYTFGNSFQVFYDDVRTFGVRGALSLDVARDFTLGAQVDYNTYDTETDNPAWNLPEIQAKVWFDYQMGEQWFFGGQLFYVGERDDLEAVVVESGNPAEFPANIITLDAYLDANLHAGYRFNNQLSIFVKGSNLAGDYQKWARFPTQGLQVLAGATYKFDMFQ
ncbi:TonB-dependent receptor domain-containing protein [Sediminicola luteus]|nr:TonB-dependent receptor [Sediminicola luteus]